MIHMAGEYLGVIRVVGIAVITLAGQESAGAGAYISAARQPECRRRHTCVGCKVVEERQLERSRLALRSRRLSTDAVQWQQHLLRNQCVCTGCRQQRQHQHVFQPSYHVQSSRESSSSGEGRPSPYSSSIILLESTLNSRTIRSTSVSSGSIYHSSTSVP